jgi:TRAP-type C4-dicarboxylate transport system permease small subunit
MIAAYIRFVAALMQVARIVIGVLLIASVALNFGNVFGRYALHAPIVGAEEVMAFFLVGIVFIGFPRVMWEGRHIKMDILTNLLPPRWQRVLEYFVALVSMAAGGLLIYIAVPVIMHLVGFDERSQAANVPLALPQAMIPIGFILMMLVIIARLLDPSRRYVPPDSHERGEDPA